MSNEIKEVLKGSLAEELELEPGDKILKINGAEINDILDYKFFICDENILLEIEKKNGELWEIDLEKEYDENLGVIFKEPIMDKAMRCSNNCIFCFIDQLPKGMRETLYFKDDDSRLSFLQGNFVTLTNLSDEDLNRIVKYRISPINISVHTTNPELRVKMLRNRFAGNIYERLRKLADAGINMNCQIVLCPGINDGDEYRRTCMDLFKLHPCIRNVAVVPVGLTKYRAGLYELKMYDKEAALKVIEETNEMQNYFIKNADNKFVRLSDEFYITAEKDVPDAAFYGDFEQLEDGIGMTAYFRKNINETIGKLNKNLKGSFTIATGESAFNEMNNFACRINKINNNISINVVKIINYFFGETITVAGLITGKDIAEQLSQAEKGNILLIPDTMLRKDYEIGDDKSRVFLDDMTIESLEKILNRKIAVCDYTGKNIIDVINSYCKEVF